MAYLKWPIYIAPFKDPFAQPRGAHHTQFYFDWICTFAAKEDVFCQRLHEALDIWYGRFPATKSVPDHRLATSFQEQVGEECWMILKLEMQREMVPVVVVVAIK